MFNHKTEGYLDRIQELTCGKGVDVILEMLANVNLDRDLLALATGGRVVIIGSRGRVDGKAATSNDAARQVGTARCDRVRV